ncbi:MAG: type II CAAX endopeptidase family protein [Chloroflexi bacterium]|nr:type II CAAX endopeptidase family protein [Chloroflexota bacterium]
MSRVEAAPWGAFDVVKGLVLVLVGGAALVGIGLWLNSVDAFGELATVLLTSAALQGLMLAAALWFSISKYGATFEVLGFCKSEGLAGWLVPFIGLVVSLLLTAAYVLFVEYIGVESLKPPDLPAAVRDAEGLARAAAAFVIIVIGPVAEETFFRGFVFQGIRSRLGVIGAAVLSSALFALAHGDVGLLAPAFMSGLVLTWVFVKTRCLGPAILAHSLQNFLAFIAIT